jgi:hypothetical protein
MSHSNYDVLAKTSDLMSDVFAKIKPTDPLRKLRLSQQTNRTKKTN